MISTAALQSSVSDITIVDCQHTYLLAEAHAVLNHCRSPAGSIAASHDHEQPQLVVLIHGALKRFTTKLKASSAMLTETPACSTDRARHAAIGSGPSTETPWQSPVAQVLLRMLATMIEQFLANAGSSISRCNDFEHSDVHQMHSASQPAMSCSCKTWLTFLY
jgi:hypothetical protein